MKNILVCAAMLSAFACGQAVTAPPTGGNPRHTAQLQAAAEALPGFGGLHVSGATLIINLTDLAEANGAQVTVVPLATEAGYAAVEFRQCDFTWVQLNDWLFALRGALTVRGTVNLDADEVRNRVVIGIEYEPARSLVQAFVDSNPTVPREAVLIEVHGRAVAGSTPL